MVSAWSLTPYRPKPRDLPWPNYVSNVRREADAAVDRLLEAVEQIVAGEYRGTDLGVVLDAQDIAQHTDRQTDSLRPMTLTRRITCEASRNVIMKLLGDIKIYQVPICNLCKAQADWGEVSVGLFGWACANKDFHGKYTYLKRDQVKWIEVIPLREEDE